MTINTKCSTHGREQCMECSLSVSAAEHEKLMFVPNITLSPFDQIGKVDWKCQHHGDSRFMWACVECVKEQLAKEYERGKKEAAQPKAESETVNKLREMIKDMNETMNREREIYKKNYVGWIASKKDFRELCDLKKDYAMLRYEHEKARNQLDAASRIVNALALGELYSPSLQQALKDWEAL